MKRAFLSGIAALIATHSKAGYAAIYGCPEGSEAIHHCHDCPGERHVEYARTRAGGFVKRGYYATLVGALSTLATWTDGVANGDIIILPELSGSYDPGTPKELKGFGNRKVTYGAREMTWTFSDPEYLDNYDFYNEITQRSNLIPFFITSSLLHLFDKEATIVGGDPIVDDLEEIVVWNGTAKIVSNNLPAKHALTGIEDVFTCATF